MCSTRCQLQFTKLRNSICNINTCRLNRIPTSTHANGRNVITVSIRTRSTTPTDTIPSIRWIKFQLFKKGIKSVSHDSRRSTCQAISWLFIFTIVTQQKNHKWIIQQDRLSHALALPTFAERECPSS